MFSTFSSPSWGIEVKDSGVTTDVSPISPSFVIGTGVMRKTYELSSSSYMVIRSMRTLEIYVPLDVLVSPSCAIATTNDLVCCVMMLGFFGQAVSPSGIVSEPFISSPILIVLTGMNLKGFVKGSRGCHFQIFV
jgi:hypothetical protein